VSLTSFINPGSVDQGNSVLVEKLFNASGAKMNLQTTVTMITKTNDGRYVVEATPASSSSSSSSASSATVTETVDIVVLACPFEFLNIEFKNIELPEIPLRKFRHWFVTVVRAHAIQPKFFGVTDTKSFPYTDVLTTHHSTLPFNVLQTEATLPDNTSYYKMFSNGDLSADLESIFIGVVGQPRVQHWNFTFPEFEHSPTYQPIHIDDGIYYLNAIESVASAMEVSVVAGRNVALLINKTL